MLPVIEGCFETEDLVKYLDFFVVRRKLNNPAEGCHVTHTISRT